MTFSFYKQKDYKDCGANCLKLIAKHYTKTISTQGLRELSETTREGSNLLNLSEAAEKLGFHSLGIKIDLEKLKEVPLPYILHWNKNHYVVLYKIRKEKFYISDPAHGLLVLFIIKVAVELTLEHLFDPTFWICFKKPVSSSWVLNCFRKSSELNHLSS